MEDRKANNGKVNTGIINGETLARIRIIHLVTPRIARIIHLVETPGIRQFQNDVGGVEMGPPPGLKNPANGAPKNNKRIHLVSRPLKFGLED